MATRDLKAILADGEVLIRVGEEPDGVNPATQAELDAALAALPGTFAPLTDEQLWIPAGEFILTGGSAAFAVVAARWGGFAYDATTTETAGAHTEVPGSWATMHVDLYWTNMGAGAGNVLWSMQLDRAADGENLAVTGGGGTLSPAAIAAPAQDILKVSRMATSQAVVPAKFLNTRVSRIGGDGTDTLANDAGVLGVLLTRAS